MADTASSPLEEFERLLSVTLHENYPADGITRFRVSKEDLTAHYLSAVGSAANRMGLLAVPERRGLSEGPGERFDAVLQDRVGRVVAPVEWEYAEVVKGNTRSGHTLNKNVNEFKKMKYLCSRHGESPAFACYIGYVKQEKLGLALDLVNGLWASCAVPLLLILIQFTKEPIPIERRLDKSDEKPKRVFKKMTITRITGDGRPLLLREEEALPWKARAGQD